MTEMDKENYRGTLFGVGVGPGDPELLTLKALRVIQAAPVIAVPHAKVDGDSYALQIVQDLLRPEQLVIKLHFPMVRDLAARKQHRRQAAETVAGHLAQGRDVAFLTEGDPLLYSTFAHVLAHMPDGTPVEVVPGISSVHAAAAQARLPLVQAEQRLAILPATVENLADLPTILDLFDTIILFKLKRTLDRVLCALDALGLTEGAVLVERASHPSGRVVHDVRTLQESGVHYLSLLIVSKSGEADDAN
jgi:precorrin-2/cobalt-factor-2 C20-methyltransferase